MPGKPGTPREPPRSSEHPSGGKKLRAPLLPFVPIHFHGAGGALFGTLAYLRDHRSVFTATLPGAFCLPTKGAAGTTQPPGLPSESSSRPEARDPGAASACSQSSFPKLPRRSQPGGVFYTGPLSVQRMRENAYGEDWRAAGTLWGPLPSPPMGAGVGGALSRCSGVQASSLQCVPRHIIRAHFCRNKGSKQDQQGIYYYTRLAVPFRAAPAW